MILVMKYFIFQTNIKKLAPIYENFDKELTAIIEIEQEIALMTNKIEQHNRKWRFYNS